MWKETKALRTIEGHDLISNLPDHILSYVLSFLPTKNAVLTSVLSKRWMHLSASIHDINLDDTLLFPGASMFILNSEDSRPGDGFKSIVSKVLLARVSTNIDRFRLSCATNCDYSTVSRWFSEGLLLNVRELDISVSVEEPCVVPLEIFTCRSLESLKLNCGQNCVFTVPDSVVLPNLKVLYLKKVIFVDDDSIRRFFLGCPALEKLHLYSCQLEALETFEISLPLLKNLKLSKYSLDGSCYFVLDTPNLQHLVCWLSEPSVYVMKNTKSLVSVVVASSLRSSSLNYEFQEMEDLGLILGESISVLINGNSRVKSLSLLWLSLTALYYSPRPLAKFHNLTYLELSTSQNPGYDLLPDLLESCPNLEVLSFPEGFVFLDAYDHHITYRLPDNVPLCLSRSLREILIGDFNGFDYEFELVEYLLNNSDVLRKMTIGWEVHPVLRKSDRHPYKSFGVRPDCVSPTCDRLSKAPRKSKTCEVVISWKQRFSQDHSEDCSEKLCRRTI